MLFLRSVFGLSKKAIWSNVAKDIGGEFKDGGFWGKDECDRRSRNAVAHLATAPSSPILQSLPQLRFCSTNSVNPKTTSPKHQTGQLSFCRPVRGAIAPLTNFTIASTTMPRSAS
ncbi:MAG: hypothetical protein F6J87_27470 [Spirulina sp. SIO3F2]|nr:hypothetical protein [Spirulina sp. SIO3F2]